MPSLAEFPYVVRVVSEITESNGSSSMASVCGAVSYTHLLPESEYKKALISLAYLSVDRTY